jgi:ketosteroid isomerase-like protein
MAQANAEIVRRIYAAWSQDEYPGPLELLDPEIEYVNPGGAIEPGTRRGLDEFIKAVEKVLDAYEYWHVDVERLDCIDDQVVAVVTYRLRGRGSRIEIEGRESALWTLRDGKVTRYAWFHGVDDAAAAAASST